MLIELNDQAVLSIGVQRTNAAILLDSTLCVLFF